MGKQERLKQESGRSMVEMLGTLAIIGVLTIGGIAGYNFAINKHRTNEILDGASKRAIVVTTQMSLGVPLSLAEFENDNVNAGGIFTGVDNYPDAGQFGILVNGVQKPVCQNLVKSMAWAKGSLKGVAKQVTGENAQVTDIDEDACEEENNLVLVYNYDAKGSESGSPSGTSSTGGSNSASSSGEPECQKVEKKYFTGTCCDEEHTTSVCPDEVPPSCIVAAEDKAQCEANCDDDNSSQLCCEKYSFSWDSEHAKCCLNWNTGPQFDTQTCCESFGRLWDTAGNTCCGSDTKFCCEANGRTWDTANNKCCEGSDFSTQICCESNGSTWDNGNNICCYDSGPSSSAVCCVAYGRAWSSEGNKCCSKDDNYGVCCEAWGYTWDNTQGCIGWVEKQ